MTLNIHGKEIIVPDNAEVRISGAEVFVKLLPAQVPDSPYLDWTKQLDKQIKQREQVPFGQSMGLNPYQTQCGQATSGYMQPLSAFNGPGNLNAGFNGNVSDNLARFHSEPSFKG